MRIGPDGAGGRLLWVEYGELRAYGLDDLLDGVTSARTTGWAALLSFGLASSDTQLWSTPLSTASPWDTRTRAVRIDPTVVDGLLTEVEGGGPGYGAHAVEAALDDLDGDGLLDWWQLDEGKLTWHALTPGVSVTVCDGTSAEVPDWSAAQAGDDLDGDGVPEVAWWGESAWTGVWSSTRGAITTDSDFDGTLTWLDCDVTGDAIDDLQFGTFGRSYPVDGTAWLTSGLEPSALSTIDADAVCLGDLDGDGISEIATAFTDLTVYSGTSVADGRPVALATIEGPKLGRVAALGDIDGDGLGDLSFYAFDGRNATCLVTAADLLATPTRALADVVCDAYALYTPADVDGDGVNELLTTDTDTITAWWPFAGREEVVCTAADGTREEPLLGLLAGAFGPGTAAVVLGPDPVVVYALE
jgi:hypothetical protein